MTECHLALSDADRLKLLDLLMESDFREAVADDPIAAMAAEGIEFTQQDLDDLPDGVVLPSIADLEAHRQEFEDAIATNGAAFFIFNLLCRTTDCES